MERRIFFPARDEDHPAYTAPILSHRQQAVIGGLLSPTRETNTETDIDTVTLPRDPVRKSLVGLNLDQFRPVRRDMGSLDLTMLDEFESNKPWWFFLTSKTLKLQTEL